MMDNEHAINCLKALSDKYDFHCSNCEYSSTCGADGLSNAADYLLLAISRLQEYQPPN